jgi:hypothetical protein
MKKSIFSMMLLAILLSACGPSQKIASSWVNREVLPKGPYKKMFVAAMMANKSAKYTIEDQLANLINSRGKKAVRSNDVFPSTFFEDSNLTKEQLANAIKKTGCDAVFMVTLLDVEKEERYVPGSATYISAYGSPYGGYYGSYYGYYSYMYPITYDPGYYTTDKKYLMETNFYDVESDLLLFSIRSTAVNPSDLEKWFKGYSALILAQLKKEGLIQN